MTTAISSSNLVPIKAVVYDSNVTSNTTNSSSSSSSSGAVTLNLSWKAGVAIGALVASPFLLGL
ncbi:unnamed protein product [Cyberlindnera jadinii]|uniref:Uncharacterized protein n=1 Tax=Cyberlindnera jadinii (strain ATCC 18201 / CBS 1600 / BCRC 20928 / JCM 3617 / NBRC 0987 / NRRL Y-1542) TaxID=983966 RepID=A0A0H5C8W8_CYBJN|nr:unnamed protein product [Cyberlindnera jadinii]